MNGLDLLLHPSVDIGHAIQLSVAPVFLLSGVGVLLGMFTSRLARIIDRARPLEERLRVLRRHDAQCDEAAESTVTLAALARRARYINHAITLCTCAALLVALVVVFLFVSAYVTFNLGSIVAVCFVLAMVSLIAALVSFLFEVRIATATVRIGPHRNH